MSDILIHQLRFQYPRSEFQLAIPELTISAGEKVAVVGPSGSGKTTLLNLIAGISVPDTGNIRLGETVISKMNDRSRRDYRINRIGLVFQQFELIEYLNVTQNILLPYSINESMGGLRQARTRAKQLAQQVGLGDKLRRFPRQLSQGEQQRVAICRALVTEPQLILADEPTGNLDPTNKRTILDILFQVCESGGQSLIVVTHDMQILDGFDRTIDFLSFASRKETPVEQGASV